MPVSRTAAALMLAVSTLTAGCAKDIRPAAYSEQQVGETATAYEGTVVSSREVIVTAGDSPGSGAGTVLGGVTGGIAGSQFGSGKGALATTAGGAILGGVLGAVAENQLKKQPAIEYMVRLDSGALKAVVQDVQPRFTDGQNVYLLVSYNGRSRLIARQQEALPSAEERDASPAASNE